MVVNVPKTKAMFLAYRTAANKILENRPDLKLSDETYKHINKRKKLLGVQIDNTPSWTAQVECIIKECNSLLHLLNRIKCYLPIPTRKLFFNAYILPNIDNCCTVWGNISSALTDCMKKLQKRAARIILDKGIDTPSVEMFNQLSWMTFPERETFQKVVMMYKFSTISLNHIFQNISR